MDCKYVRQNQYLCFTFNPTSTSFFYLAYVKNKLRIVEENLYNSLIINEFIVPIKEQDLDVDNFALSYNQLHQLIIFTLSDHILIYSIAKRILVFAGQARGRNPYFITRSVTLGRQLFFAATEQHNVYSIDLLSCIESASINHYKKYKLPPQTSVIDLDIIPKKIAAICSDCNLRVWQVDTMNPLRGVALEKTGTPLCLQFSKGGTYLLVGTSAGYVQAFDGDTLGISNTLVLNQKISNQSIRSLGWFHYSGEEQSRRFLSLTQDGNIKLYSFYFQRQRKDTFMGKATELSLLYINRTKIKAEPKVLAHNFSNFILFTPGILLYMVDHYPRIYYPVITQQITHTFESLVPDAHREIVWQRDFLFMDGLDIKRLRDQVETKVSLSNVLEYQGLKMLKLDFRPISKKPANRYKFLLSYYSGSMVRSLILSKVNLDTTTQTVQNFKEYAGTNVLFLGSREYYQPLILIVQEDRETITILCEEEFEKSQLELAETDERAMLQLGPGQIYTRGIKIKIHRVYITPFRNYYVVIYQSENLLRYSNNVNYNSQILDYSVCGDVSLRLAFSDIIIDVIWTSKGEVGCVVCLDKIVFINSQLKIIRQAMIFGYVVQAQWTGYTLIVTTKIDVQYLDVYGKCVQLYCLEDYDSKYLIMGMLGDRVLGIQKRGGKIGCKIRYLNLMQPLLVGYLAYHKLMEMPIQPLLCKRIIQAYSPFFLVSESFLVLLNEHQLTSFSQYFIENNTTLYSRSIRGSTLNNSIKMERFIDSIVWQKNKKAIIDSFLSYWELHDSSDPYYQQKAQQHLKQFSLIIANPLTVTSILNAAKNPQHKTINIVSNFGEKGLVQVYMDVKDGQNIKMEILGFKAENVGEWVGQFGAYIQSKIGQSETVEVVQKQEQHQEQDQSEFKSLIVYYRLDEGKGQTVQDLSDYGNDAVITHPTDQMWIQLDEDPMQIEDKWGKKCPPQFALSLSPKSYIIRQKKLNVKSITLMSIQMWVKCQSSSFTLLKIGSSVQLGINEGAWFVKSQSVTKKLKNVNEESQIKMKIWTHLCWIYNKQPGTLKLLINSMLSYECSIDLKLDNLGLMVGIQGDITQIRIWKRCLGIDQIKQSMRTPLGIVAEKRKRLKMKLKEKKKNTENIGSMFPSLQF